MKVMLQIDKGRTFNKAPLLGQKLLFIAKRGPEISEEY